MTGYRAVQHYLALKKHFNSDKYNFFNTPRVDLPEAAYLKRRDRVLWEVLAQKYSTSVAIIPYMVSNFAYGNPNFLYDGEIAIANHTTWVKNQQSITRLFENDLCKIAEEKDKGFSNQDMMNFVGMEPPHILNMFLGKHISLETMVILNSEINYINEWKSQMSSFFENEIRLIDKSQKFIKFNKVKTAEIYVQQMLEV